MSSYFVLLVSGFSEFAEMPNATRTATHENSKTSVTTAKSTADITKFRANVKLSMTENPKRGSSARPELARLPKHQDVRLISKGWKLFVTARKIGQDSQVVELAEPRTLTTSEPRETGHRCSWMPTEEARHLQVGHFEANFRR